MSLDGLSDRAQVEDPPSPVGRFRDSIVGQITTRSVLLAGIPVLLVGLLTIASLFVLNGRAERGLERAQDELAAATIGTGRAQEAELVLVRMDDFVAERVDDVVDWTEADVVVDAAGADRPEIQQYISLPVERVEEVFDSSDELDSSGISSRFLAGQIGDRPAFAEVFFTDANGFNVAATNPTSDFVQRDEEWWQSAWETGAFIGPLVFDESANVFSFEVAIRIEDRLDRPIGVMKAVIDATVLHTFADDFATAGEGGVQVRVLTTDGVLLAETVSDHDPGRVGERVAFESDQGEVFDAAVEAAGRSGSAAEISSDFLILGETVAGFSSTPATRSIPRLGVEAPVERWVAIVEQPAVEALAPLDGIEELQSDLSLTARVLAGVVAALVGLAIATSFFVSRVVARRIAGPINRLQAQAHRVANDELPELVASLRVPGRTGDLPVVEPIDVEATGEVADLADAFNSVRSTAVHLAAGQAIGRTRDVAALLLNLGRRNQQLVGRQLEFIDQLERSESDPANLQNLFELDQMATRMRRNAESLVVLAGEETRRRGTKPVTIDDVIRASISAVEDYERVMITDVAPTWVRPQVGGDLGHLLAELIENAASYSPPESRVEIMGTAGHDDSYTISIIDRGIGMSPGQLEAANALIREPISTEDAATNRLGLLVVGRLANRHGIDARLVESASDGLTAKVTLPAELLVDVPPRASSNPPSLLDSDLKLAQEIARTVAAGETPALAAPQRQPRTSVVDDRADLPTPPVRPSPKAPNPTPVASAPLATRLSIDRAGTAERADAELAAGSGPEPLAAAPRRLASTARPPAGDRFIADVTTGSVGPGIEDRTTSQPADRSSVGGDDMSEPTRDTPFRRRTRTTPGDDSPRIEHSVDTPADGERSDVGEARAAHVRQTLSRYTIGLEAGSAHPPTDARLAHQRAADVRGNLVGFAEGLERGRASADPSFPDRTDDPEDPPASRADQAASGETADPPSTVDGGNADDRDQQT